MDYMNGDAAAVAPAQFHQMTITEWMDMKKKLAQELQNVTMGFVRIGYALRKIDDGKLYAQDGYSSVAEFAKAEYGLEGSAVSRFMAINRKYSIGGYSERLRPEFIGLGQSKLSEMLALPDEDLGMIRPEMAREDIRELKRFEKTEPEAGVAEDIFQLFEEFFRADPEAVREIYSDPDDPQTPCGPEDLKEIINPSGSRSFRKGMYFVAFYDQDIKVKKFGEQQPRTLSWEDLHRIIRAIFAESADGACTYGNHFGIIEEDSDGHEGHNGADRKTETGGSGESQTRGTKTGRTAESPETDIPGKTEGGEPDQEERTAGAEGDNEPAAAAVVGQRGTDGQGAGAPETDRGNRRNCAGAIPGGKRDGMGSRPEAAAGRFGRGAQQGCP